ncbi:MAG: 50S ribosomal protein L15 [Candidatus Tyrphobacter sp.]
MAEKKKAKKSPARPAAKRGAPATGKARAKKTPARATVAKSQPAPAAPSQTGLGDKRGALKLGSLRPAKGSRPKRQRIGRGHGSGMVKTGGEGGKGQTVRSGGGKGRTFEGGQTPWARRLPHRRGYSQKARDIGHFRARYAVVNVRELSKWDPHVEVSPETLRERGILRNALDGVKILGGTKPGATLPQGMRFRDVVFSASAREALGLAGADLGEEAETT